MNEIKLDNLIIEDKIEEVIDELSKDTKAKKSKVEKAKKTEKKQKDHLFKPGQSGNPNGRPKGTFSFIPLLKRKLKEKHLDTDKTKGEMVVDKLITKAIEDNNYQWLKELFDRIDGKAMQKIKGDLGITAGSILDQCLNEEDETD